jgi:transcriptional regulator with XRE-family HTH domain
MSQQCLARRAGVPQSTVSRLESGRIEPNLQTVSKILQAMACDFVIAPLLQESVELLRRKQARKLAEKHVGYLRGTMSLEKQKPDAKFIETLLKQEEEKLLRGPNAQLWME